MPHLDLADFHLGAVLGVGTVGTIYDGSIPDDREVPPVVEALRGKPLAIKKLHPAVSSDELIRARFQREMLILERLQHPNIIGYYGGGSCDGGQLFYVMERVDGGTIKDLLESSGALAWPVVVEVARQVCSALQCAHNHGVIHRDLKPGNLFLTRDAQIKLGDFGIARDQHSADLTNQGLTVGTHAYMAPEQITGESTISGQVDLYALGCCLFEMLSNRKVFLGENFAQLFEQHLRSQPPRVKTLIGDVPDELDEMIDRCLAKRAEDRPFNARAIQGAMLEIGEKYGLAVDATLPVNETTDVSAGEVVPSTELSEHELATLKGRQLLEHQIQARLGGIPREPIAGWKLAVFVALIVVGIAVASVVGQ